MANLAIFGLLTAFFVLAGGFLPYINAEYDTGDTNTYDGVDTFEEGVEGESIGILSVWSIALSIISMPVWTFGALPFWVDLFLWIFRIVWWALVVELLWIG